MPRAFRTDTADDDLRTIAYQIGMESGRPLTAEKIVDEIIDCCDYIAELGSQAQLGTSASELGRGIRLLSYRRWVVIFRYIDEGAVILRIADGSQDYFSWKFGET